MIETFSDFAQFKRKAAELDVNVNLDELQEIDVVFLESYGNYVILAIKTTGGKKNDILVLGEKNSLLYSEKTFGEKDYRIFKHTLQKQYGESTVLTLLTLRSTLEDYSGAFKILDETIDSLEAEYRPGLAEETTTKLRRLTNRVEDFATLMMSLEERKIVQVNANLVTYDYGITTAKAQHLLDRCRNHLHQLRDIQRQAEMKESHEMNRNIAELASAAKKLAAISAILLVPVIIAGHFGFNFNYLTGLGAMPSAFPTLLVAEIALTALAAWYLKKMRWF
ncbi:TPA: hypothetical protein HA244_03565 [Candidatus Micrarchaeota archaeon]|nr:hypothetical protein [Candidatus Micrarchaeota archaeon]